MIIYYKTLVYSNDLTTEQVLQENKKYKITYCCDTMKEAVQQQVLDLTGKELFLLKKDDYEPSTTVWYGYPLKYCPFCGGKIEHVEEYKARVVQYNVRIPTKTILARSERRNKEVRITCPNENINHE